MRDINQAGLDLIKSFEGIIDGNPATVNYDPYVDPVGIYTIGWGHAIVWGNGFLKTSTPNAKAIAKQLYPNGLTREEAEELLRNDIRAHSIPVEGLIKVPVTDNQFAALVSFAFNLGVNNLRNSTLLRKLNARDYDGAALEFQKWNKAGGKVLKGLTRRREAEATLFRTP
ncbi:MAG TPA: lysozyme [Pyrinomonadaceae bacterium]|nr:lysozyme [Pyrinomonadaceae bacterium]